MDRILKMSLKSFTLEELRDLKKEIKKEIQNKEHEEWEKWEAARGNYVTLKWGSLKSCKFPTAKGWKEIMDEYEETDDKSDEHKELLCKLIDLTDGGPEDEVVYLHWDGVYVTKEKAKEYVLNYGKEDA